MIPSLRSGLVRAAFVAALFSCSALLAAAAEAVRAFDVPAGDAAATLKAAAKQGGVEIVFPAATVSGVQTAPVKGDFTAREAINRMLADTDLVLVQDEKSGVLSVQRLTPDAKNASSRLAEAQTASSAEASSAEKGGGYAVKDGAVQLEEFTVTGSRIRSLVGEQTAQPVFTLTREQIERTGVNNVGDLLRYIPAVTATSNGNFGSIAGTSANGQEAQGTLAQSSNASGIAATIHGFPGATTLFLVDGRRVPKVNVIGVGQQRYEVPGLPIAAIERVEVLLDGASAIYGADAVAGVINIITRKNYSGAELRLGYENNWETDAAQRSVNLTYGLARDRWSLLLTLGIRDETPLGFRDVSYLATVNRSQWGGLDGRSTTLVDGTGYVRSTNGSNLPGLTSDRAAIPSGSNGQNLTIADFANAGPISTERYDNQKYYVRPITRESAGRLKSEYRYRPWLTAYVEGAWTKTVFSNSGLGLPINTTPATGVTLPAGYPGNPFGVPIVLYKVFWDVRADTGRITRESTSFTTGMRGNFGRGWRYDASIALARVSTDHAASYGPSSITNASIAPAFTATQKPALVYDSRAGNPNPPGLLDPYLQQGGPATNETSTYWTYTAQADGPIWTLPSGDIRMAVGAEAREEYVDQSVDWGRIPLSSQIRSVPSILNQTSLGTFVETRVPLVSEAQRWLMLHRAELTGALRRDDYEGRNGATVPSASVLLQPVKWLTLRSTYSEGFKSPELNELYRSPTTTTINTSSAAYLDPLRGNQPIPVPFTTMAVGNPDLKPESSKSWTYGVVTDIPGVKGLSVSASYWMTDYIDRIVSSQNAVMTIAEAIQLYPDMILSRSPNLIGDPAGWPGPITALKTYPINISQVNLAGWEASARYSRVTPWGELNLRADYSRMLKSDYYTRAGGPKTSTSGTYQFPQQISGSAFWSRGAVELGALATYRSAWRNDAAGSSRNYGSIIRWDVQGSYDFDRAPWMQGERTWWRAALKGTRISGAFFNVFNVQPIFNNPTNANQRGFFDFSLFPGYAIQRYSLQLTKRF